MKETPIDSPFEILVLGSGTSHGVPMIGCDCAVCMSNNPKNKRFRPSVVVRYGGKSILIDTTPELRLQSLTFNLNRVDAVLITHTHADHIFGLDDLRRFNDIQNIEIPVYGDEGILDDIKRIYNYIFKETQFAGGKPRVILRQVEPVMMFWGLKVTSFYVLHGKLPVLAYRFDAPPTPTRPARSMAYVTDLSCLPDEGKSLLQGLDVLFLDTVRFEPHPTHLGLYQAIELIEELKPKQSYLVHLSHHFDHDAVNASLPTGIELSYDGLSVML